MRRFLDHFPPDASVGIHGATPLLAEVEPLAHGFTDLLSLHGGNSFRGGVYRIHAPQEIEHWTAIAEDAFPDYRGRILCFGYDWLGRQFALDRRSDSGGQSHVLLMDLGFGEVLNIPASFEEFHNGELVDFADAALAEPFYKKGLSSSGRAPGLDECVGYRVPPHLGGKDEVSNLEVTDMAVYWGLLGQITSRINERK